LDPHVFSFKLSDNSSLSRVPSWEDQRRRRQTESIGLDGTAWPPPAQFLPGAFGRNARM